MAIRSKFITLDDVLADDRPAAISLPYAVPIFVGTELGKCGMIDYDNPSQIMITDSLNEFFKAVGIPEQTTFYSFRPDRPDDKDRRPGGHNQGVDWPHGWLYRTGGRLPGSDCGV